MATNITARLSSLRKEKGLSQKEAAAGLGVSQALLSHYENGIRECGLDFLCRAADYYNVTTDYLLGLERLTTVDVTGLADRDVAVLAELAERLKNCKD